MAQGTALIFRPMSKLVPFGQEALKLKPKSYYPALWMGMLVLTATFTIYAQS
jgi:hypothetical protein